MERGKVKEMLSYELCSLGTTMVYDKFTKTITFKSPDSEDPMVTLDALLDFINVINKSGECKLCALEGSYLGAREAIHDMLDELDKRNAEVLT